MSFRSIAEATGIQLGQPVHADTNATPAGQANPYGLYQAPGYTPGYVTGAVDNPATAMTPAPAPQTNPSNPYGLYQAPGYVQGQVTGTTPAPVYQPLTRPEPVYQAPPQMYQAPGYVQGQVTGAYTPEPQPMLTRPEPVYQAPPQMYQAPGYVQGQVTGTRADPVYQPLTRPEPVYQAPGRSVATAPVAPANTTQYYSAPASDNNMPTNASGGAVTQKSRATLQQEVFGGLNKPLYDQYVAAVNNGKLPPGKRDPRLPAIQDGDAFSEQGFRNFAQNVTGKGNLPQEEYNTLNNPSLVGYAPRTAPVTIPAETLINNNRGLYNMWIDYTNPSDKSDVNSFAKWAALNGYPTLVGESAADKFAAFKEAKAAGLAPVAPATQPVTSTVTTPTFTSTGAVKIPTATVTPTVATPRLQTATAPTGPSRPGYTAPSGRVYANWTPKRKVVA